MVSPVHEYRETHRRVVTLACEEKVMLRKWDTEYKELIDASYSKYARKRFILVTGDHYCDGEFMSRWSQYLPNELRG